MNPSCSLDQKQCIPCQGGVPPLDAAAIQHLLHELQGGWTVNPAGHLYKKITFPDFITAMHYANKIAELAERENHHPDLAITWGSCSIEIWTHKINGLTESDFILAAKIDKL